MAKSASKPAKDSKGTSKKVKPTAKDKAATKQAKAAKKVARRARFSQLRQAFTVTRKADSKLVPIMIVAFLVPFALLTALGLLIGGFLLAPFILFGILFGLLAAVAIFGRRAQSNAYASVEGTPGAAASVIESMRGDWRVTPAVGFTTQQDLLHRVLGRPGVILVREGSPNRTKGLIVTEKKKLARFVGDTPVYEVSVGAGEGSLTLKQLERHISKLPRNIKPKEINILDRKLKAMAPALPIPKGPMPGGGRMPRGPRR